MRPGMTLDSLADSIDDSKLKDVDSDDDEIEEDDVSSKGSLETEEDLRYVAILEEAEKAIREIESKKQKFFMTASNVTKEHEFLMNDEIFVLGKANKPKQPSSECKSCIVIPLKSEGAKNHCEFCGHTVCKDCF